MDFKTGIFSITYSTLVNLNYNIIVVLNHIGPSNVILPSLASVTMATDIHSNNFTFQNILNCKVPPNVGINIYQ